MEPKTFRSKRGPEAKIQDAIINMLRMKGWYVMKTHGSMYQSGFPDLYATNTKYGARWIEVKNKDHYSFTPAQCDCFPKLSANGTRIWILVGATESEYNKLFGPENWFMYMMRMRGYGK